MFSDTIEHCHEKKDSIHSFSISHLINLVADNKFKTGISNVNQGHFPQPRSRKVVLNRCIVRFHFVSLKYDSCNAIFCYIPEAIHTLSNVENHWLTRPCKTSVRCKL